ncbi:MAG: DNA-binding protein [Chloroflexi bacterium]|nr:MAG: DNA-binding protein [Chloroflexota bacterium]
MSKHHSIRPPIVPTRVYSRAEVAEILNVSMSTVKRLLASGQLRASQPPGLRRVFITGQAILDMLAENEGSYEEERDLA